MKILVMSDSHSSLRFMRRCIQKLCPDQVVHLGDHYDDAEALAEEFSHIRFHQVPGNCDRYRVRPGVHAFLCSSMGGVMVFMTHGHLHQVKQDTGRLLADARSYGAQVVLYGHTHRGECYQCTDGLWVMNPGSCGSDGGSVGLLEISDETVTACRIFRQADIEAC